jgi:hypothetical protein
VRENYLAKGRRYVAEGRLVVRELDEHGGVVLADVRGAGAIWSVGRDERGWWCSCPAYSTCAHIAALQLVVALEPREAPC